MATVHAARNWKIKVHVDYHPVPHFHVVEGTPPNTRSISVAIADLKILAPRGKSCPDWAKEALEWAKANRETIQAEWDRITQSNGGQ